MLALVSIRSGRRNVLTRPPLRIEPILAPLLIESLIRVSSAAGTRMKCIFWCRTVVVKLVRLLTILLFSVTMTLCCLTCLFSS